MNEDSTKYWQKKTQRFFLIWFFLIGTVLVISSGIYGGTIYVQKVNINLDKWSSPELTLTAVYLGLLRDMLPISVCLIIALLTPPLGLVAFCKLAKSQMHSLVKERILQITLRNSILVVAPIFLILGLITSLTTAYLNVEHKILSDIFKFRDYAIFFIKSTLFVATIIGLSWIEIAYFINVKKVVRRLSTCIVHILMAWAALFTIDYSVNYVLKFFDK